MDEVYEVRGLRALWESDRGCVSQPYGVSMAGLEQRRLKEREAKARLERRRFVEERARIRREGFFNGHVPEWVDEPELVEPAMGVFVGDEYSFALPA